MRLRTQKQPQVKKELCRLLDDVDVNVDGNLVMTSLYERPSSVQTHVEGRRGRGVSI